MQVGLSHQHRESLICGSKRRSPAKVGLSVIFHMFPVKQAVLKSNLKFFIFLHSLSSYLPSQVIRCTDGEQAFLRVIQVVKDIRL